MHAPNLQPAYLPPDLVAGAWCDAAGRLAWFPERAVEVVHRAAAWRMAVLTAEAWWVTNREAPLNLLRGVDAQHHELHAWRVGHERDPMCEGWDDFCRRCEVGAADWLGSLRVLDVSGIRWRGQPLETRIHLELAREDQYGDGEW